MMRWHPRIRWYVLVNWNLPKRLQSKGNVSTKGYQFKSDLSNGLDPNQVDYCDDLAFVSQTSWSLEDPNNLVYRDWNDEYHGGRWHHWGLQHLRLKSSNSLPGASKDYQTKVGRCAKGQHSHPSACTTPVDMHRQRWGALAIVSCGGAAKRWIALPHGDSPVHSLRYENARWPISNSMSWIGETVSTWHFFSF